MEEVKVKKVEEKEELSVDVEEGDNRGGEERHLPRRGDAPGPWRLSLSATLIPPSQSPLLLRRTHHHTHPPLSACHPHGVTVMLALPLPSVCHVVSVLLCNFLLFFFFFLSSRRSRKECVSCRSAARCQGVATAHFRRLTQLRSPGGAWRIPRIPDLFIPPPPARL